MRNKNRIVLSITGIITVLLITIGLSYAYFSANLTGGEEATTITVTGGTMNIVYSGGANINVANIIPSDNPVATKTFTVTGNNTTDVEMKYQISLIVEENTFSEEALKYKLISTNTDNNGSIVPSINELTNIGTGTKTILLGVGEFASPTGGNKVHTYNLEIYFPDTSSNQNIDQGKEIKAHIEIRNYEVNNTTLREVILAQEGGPAAIEAKGAPDFSKIAVSQSTYDGLPETGAWNAAIKSKAVVENGIYATEDEYGTSYYYRGEKSLLNNNLIFGGFQWKIIRINGDGSVRIIYNGTEAEFNTSGTMNSTGTSTQIGTGAWNADNYGDVKYMGYMYGGANGVPSTQRHGSISAAATYNETSTHTKIQLENWYQTNIVGKSFENQILDNLYCNDRQLQNEVGGPPTGAGYGSNDDVWYAALYRLYTIKTPTLKCGLKNDRFTKNDTTIGNGALTYPVGLISADEAAMAGLAYNVIHQTSYLNTNQWFRSFTPSDFNGGSGDPTMFGITVDGFIGHYDVTSSGGLRPVLNISPDITVVGDGSATNPYKVES